MPDIRPTDPRAIDPGPTMRETAEVPDALDVRGNGDMSVAGVEADDEAVRRRAYEIWEREGHPEDRADAHWDQARRELGRHH